MDVDSLCPQRPACRTGRRELYEDHLDRRAEGLEVRLASRARQPAERVGPLERAAARTRVPGGATRIDGDRAAAAREYCGLSRRHLNARRVAERRTARSGVRK